ncbi:aromatic ring-hydroxylating dioxygenase subunit alpha [Pseudoxanthomonas sp. SGD-10]|nr:aromatic ring-hydroxylating dioxygenase subunit alpha [Pseudoxanthomonas sp. SGD-10]
MTWHPDLYRHWYAVARTGEVGERPLAVTLLDTHIALARAGDGWIALEDRCPHRHVPLSAGCVADGQLRCPYHGWSFDREGRLRHLPGLPAHAPLPGVKVRSFPVVECDGFLWLRPGTEGEPAPRELVRGTDPATRRFQWRTTWKAHVLDAMENFLDPMHTHFVHPGLVRVESRRVAARARFQATSEGFTVDYRGTPKQSGLLYRLFESERTMERAWFAAPGSARLEYRYANGSRILFDLHFSPRDAGSTEVFVGLHVEGRRAPAWAIRLLAWPLLKKVNDQDVRMLELQAGNLARFGRRRGASTPIDVVRPALERFWSEGRLPAPGECFEVEMML